jgi:hypothetical protein
LSGGAAHHEFHWQADQLCQLVERPIMLLLFGTIADAIKLATALALPAICYLLIAAYGGSAREPA